MGGIVIIGNGISGVTAARHIRKKSDVPITIISKESEYFFSRTALMYVFMGHMPFENTQPYENWFWDKNKIELKHAEVQSIDFETRMVKFSEGESMGYDKLVLATGSKPNKFGWPGQDLNGVQGLYSKQDLESLEKRCKEIDLKRAVIVGGGLIGVELAEMLLSRGIEVSFLVREDGFWGNVLSRDESELVKSQILHHGIDLRLSTELEEIQGENNEVVSVRTSLGDIIDCQLVGLTAGVSPNVDFLQGSGLELNRGILIDEAFKTSKDDVYAIGDCAEFRKPLPGRPAIEQVWYTGRIMGETLAHNLCNASPIVYQPGNWFNSAKFFDLEYQTYTKTPIMSGYDEFVWTDGARLVRVMFNEAKMFLGLNTFGIRMRHEIIDQWISEQRSVEDALIELKDANFDPEFYTQFEEQIIAKYNQEYGTNLVAKRRSWKRILGLG